MYNSNKLKGHLSLAYFALLGFIIFLFFSPFLFSLAFLSLFNKKFMDFYYWFMLKGIKFYILISPLKFSCKELPNLEKINQRKCVIVCNHRSHLDMFLFLSHVYKVRAMANSYLLMIPFLGQVIWMSGHFFVKIGNIEHYKKALKQMKMALKRKDKVLIFPESSRCTPSFLGIDKFHLTAFELARKNKVEIIPVVIKGTDDVWPKGFMRINFSKKVSIKELPAIDPNSFHDISSLVNYVHTQMLEEFQRLPT